MSFAVTARLAARNLDVSFDVPAGETLAVLGPNGAGKSTILDIIAGLVRPDSGHARLGTTHLFDVGPSTPGIWLAPHHRGVSLLAQEPLLFPHLSVLDNVAFAPRSAGHSTASSRAIARSWLVAADARELESSRPAELSGGQAQRIAIARALAAEPELLLLDEPLASLDVAAAPAVRNTIRRVLAGRSAIIVTHEMLDALSLADRVVVLNDGRVVESGSTREVLEHPRHAFTAELAGLNLVTGISTPGGLRRSDGSNLASSHDATPGAEVRAAFRPTAVSVHEERPTEKRNVLRVTVSAIEPRGELVRIRADGLYADVTPGEAAAIDLWPSREAYFSVEAHDIAVYPLDSERVA